MKLFKVNVHINVPVMVLSEDEQDVIDTAYDRYDDELCRSIPDDSRMHATFELVTDPDQVPPYLLDEPPYLVNSYTMADDTCLELLSMGGAALSLLGTITKLVIATDETRSKDLDTFVQELRESLKQFDASKSKLEGK